MANIARHRGSGDDPEGPSEVDTQRRFHRASCLHCRTLQHRRLTCNGTAPNSPPRRSKPSFRNGTSSDQPTQATMQFTENNLIGGSPPFAFPITFGTQVQLSTTLPIPLPSPQNQTMVISGPSCTFQ